MSKNKIYILLTVSIVAEVFAATMLKLTEGMTVLGPLIGVGIGYGVSFGVFGIVLKYMPISIAYAIWAGVGTVLTVIVSAIVFGEVFTMLKILGVVIVIFGIIILNLENKDEEKLN